MKKKTILYGLQMKSKRLIILNLLMTTWEENLFILTSLIPPPAVAGVPLPFRCKCNLDSGKLQDRHEICINLVPLY